MFSNYSESSNSKNPFYIGTVVDNNDPDYNYRVKVRLPKIHKNISDADLPWAARVDRAFRGIESDTPNTEGPSTESSAGGNKGKSNQSSSGKKNPPKFDHCVPEVGTKVLVLAVQNDINALIYLGALYKNTKYTPSGDKYLGSYGIYADEGQFIGIDTTKDENEITVHFIGNIDVDKVKKITVKAEDNIKIESTGSVNIDLINKSGTVNVESKKITAKATESAYVESPEITMKGHVHIIGDLDVDGEVSAKSKSVKLSTHKHPYTHCDGGESSTRTDQTEPGIG